MKASRAQAKMLAALEELAARYTALAKKVAELAEHAAEMAAAYTELSEKMEAAEAEAETEDPKKAGK